MGTYLPYNILRPQTVANAAKNQRSFYLETLNFGTDVSGRWEMSMNYFLFIIIIYDKYFVTHFNDQQITLVPFIELNLLRVALISNRYQQLSHSHHYCC